jgi:hypothetical protein
MRQSLSSKQLDNARKQRRESQSREKEAQNKIQPIKCMIEKVENDWVQLKTNIFTDGRNSPLTLHKNGSFKAQSHNENSDSKMFTQNHNLQEMH